MSAARTLVLLLATTLAYGKVPAVPAAPAAPDAGAKPTTPKYMVEVYPLPAFCLNKANANLLVAPPAGCSYGEFRIQAQNASEIEKALTSDADYGVAAVGTDKVVIYRKAKKAPSLAGPHPRLVALKTQINALARPPFSYFEILYVPGGTSSRLAPMVKTLNAEGISAEAAGNDHILLKSDSTPNAETIEDLKARIRSLGWQRSAAPPTQRLFYLDADKTLKSLSGGGADKSDSSPSTIIVSPPAVLSQPARLLLRRWPLP